MSTVPLRSSYPVPDHIGRLANVKPIKRWNDSYKDCLAALYDETWRSQDAEAVFSSRSFRRDKDEVKDVEVPENITALEWTIKEEIPVLLRVTYACSAILVRDEYRRILQHIWNAFSDSGAAAGYTPKDSIKETDWVIPFNPFLDLEVKEARLRESPGVIITGASGIGKSMFLLYVLALRLLARQATVVQFDPDEFLLFDKTGAHCICDTKSSLFCLPLDTWFLVDSNEQNIGPPQSFIDACTTYPRKLIMTASPRKDRLHDLRRKYQLLDLLWMEPFSLSEYITARHLQFAQPPSEKALERAFIDFGPSAHIVFAYAANPGRYKEKLRNELYDIQFDTVRRQVLTLNAGYLDTPFSHLALIARPVHKNPWDFYVEFASTLVLEMVCEVFDQIEEGLSRTLYGLFLKSPKARSAAGGLLQVMALWDLEKGGQWLMRRMKKYRKRTWNQENRFWAEDNSGQIRYLHIGHENQSVQISEDSVDAESTRITRIDYPRGTSPEKGAALYVPKPQSFPALEAYIYNPDTEHTVIFRSTVNASEHFINPVGLDWLQQESVDLVVITCSDGGKTISTPPTHTNKLRYVYRLEMYT